MSIFLNRELVNSKSITLYCFAFTKVKCLIYRKIISYLVRQMFGVFFFRLNVLKSWVNTTLYDWWWDIDSKHFNIEAVCFRHNTWSPLKVLLSGLVHVYYWHGGLHVAEHLIWQSSSPFVFVNGFVLGSNWWLDPGPTVNETYIKVHFLYFWMSNLFSWIEEQMSY